MRRGAIAALALALAAALAAPAAATTPRSTGMIEGTITDAAGVPLSVDGFSLSIEAFDAQTKARYSVSSQDPQGRYTLANLPAGTYKVRFRYLSSAGALVRYRWHADQPTFDTALPVDVADGARVVIDTRLDVLRGARVRGVLLSGQPLPGAIGGYGNCYGVEIFEADGVSIGVIAQKDSIGHWESAGIVPAGEMTGVARWDASLSACKRVPPHLWKWYLGPSGGGAYAAGLIADARLLAAARTFSVPETGILREINFTLLPTPDCLSRVPTIFGTTLNDTIRGTKDADVIVGLAGNDKIYGLAGSDIICGDEGNDILKGGLGRDTLIGGDGLDWVYGGGGLLDTCNAEYRTGCELGPRTG